MADFESLITPPTEDQVLDRQLAVLQLEGFPVTAWVVGTVARTLHKAVAAVIFDLWLTIALIARGATLDTAVGLWLTLLALSQYAEARKAAVFTRGTVRLTDAGGGPHTIAVGQIYVVATASGLRFRNTTGGTLPLNGTLDLEFVAETAAARYNVANGTIGTLETTLPTVTVSNPEVGTTGTWITTLGADIESDEAMRVRCRAKWATLSTGSPRDAYRYWALSFSGVTRAAVDDRNPDGPNSLRVYIDSSGLVSTVQTYVQPAGGGGKAPCGTRATIVAATTVSVPVAGTVTIEKAKRASAEAALQANLTAYALRTDIGGLVREAQVYEEIMSPDGVVDFTPGSGWTGTPNVQLGDGQIPQFNTASLVIVEA